MKIWDIKSLHSCLTTIVLNLTLIGNFVLLFNSREAIAAIIGDIVVFLQFKEFELYWGAVFFFKICSHIFMIFEVKLE